MCQIDYTKVEPDRLHLSKIMKHFKKSFTYNQNGYKN